MNKELQLRLLSDNFLYQEAVNFSKGHHNLRGNQINGLQNYSKGNWSEFERFVTHQAERNWKDSRGNIDPIGVFYEQLKNKLKWFRDQAVSQGFVPGDLAANERKKQTNDIAIRIAREFIQHLTAELLYRREGG